MSESQTKHEHHDHAEIAHGQPMNAQADMHTEPAAHGMSQPQTGTLTNGGQGVVGMRSAQNINVDHALALAAAIEGDSEHIIARAIRFAAQEKKLHVPTVTQVEAVKGRGAHAAHNGKDVWVGGPRLLEMLNMLPDSQIAEFSSEAGRKDQTVVYLIVDQKVLAAFALADVTHPESYAAIRRTT